ncbi:MAG: hypothetical protein HFI93_11375 [Lachnospiraceae bacterium]|nr:hypothetical protein [Lachnospiraceae bacterium]
MKVTQQELKFILLRPCVSLSSGGNEIYLYSLPAYGNVEGTDIFFPMGQDDTYIKGEKYLLLLEKRQSLFYDHDRYLLPAEIILPCNNLDLSTIYGIPLQKYAQNIWGISETLPFSDLDLLIENINEYEKSVDAIPITTTKEELFYTLRIHVNEFLMEAATHSGVIYLCHISDIISGDASTLLMGEPIYLVTLPGMVEAGGDYNINVQRSGSNSLVFSVTSEHAVSAIE